MSTEAGTFQPSDRVRLAEHLIPHFDGQTHGIVEGALGTRYQDVQVNVGGRVYWFAATDLTLDPEAPPQDHGPLAAVLSDRTLAKVLSRPAHDTPSLVELDQQQALDSLIANAIAWANGPSDHKGLDGALRLAVADYEQVMDR
jgi:hypothetical protein